MRVLYLHQYFNTPSVAGGTRSFEMARRLVARGHDVQMVTTDRQGGQGGWRESDVSGIRVHRLPVPYRNAMGNGERLRSFLRFAAAAGTKAARLGGDVVFATSTPLTIALPAVYAARRLGVPMVFEVRDLWPELPIAVGALRNPVARRLAYSLERLAYRSSARVVALSPGMRDGVARTGFPVERIHVIPNSADLELFRPSDEWATEFRGRFTWLGERPMVLYAGTLGRMNGVGYLARLAAEARILDPNICVVVIGEGIEEQEVRGEARRLGVLDRNFYMLGALPKLEVRKAFAAATITTSCFIDLKEMWNNSANKVFDGLASGTPVAINYRGWQAEMLEQAEAGLVLPPTDPRLAARRLVAALRDREWLSSAGRNARRLATERFARDDLAAQLESVLRQATEGREHLPRRAALARTASRRHR